MDTARGSQHLVFRMISSDYGMLVLHVASMPLESGLLLPGFGANHTVCYMLFVSNVSPRVNVSALPVIVYLAVACTLDGDHTLFLRKSNQQACCIQAEAIMLKLSQLDSKVPTLTPHISQGSHTFCITHRPHPQNPAPVANGLLMPSYRSSLLFSSLGLV